MLNKIIKVSFLVAFAGILTACAGGQIYHDKFMRGQVVGIDRGEVVVCIGSKDGAKTGQKLQAYRSIWVDSQDDDYDGYEYNDYRLEHVGVVEIKSVVNDHFARALVLDGDVKQHDIVEINR